MYLDFIQFSTKVYVSATTKQLDDGDVDELIGLYALVSRIRLFASKPVIDAAEEFATRVTKLYGEQALSIQDLRNATLTPHVDPLNGFSCRCREEMRAFLGSGKYYHPFFISAPVAAKCRRNWLQCIEDLIRDTTRLSRLLTVS